MAESIGARIRATRLLYGMSQVELARRIQISKSSMNAIEMGRQRATAEHVAAIARVLQVDAAYLLGLRERDNEHPRRGPAGERTWRAWIPLRELLRVLWLSSAV